MAMTKQEKLDKKAEALYEKKHKKRYRKSIGDWTFDILKSCILCNIYTGMYLPVLLHFH